MTPATPFPLRDEDRALFARELASFVPERIFDAHCHLWHPGHTSWKFAALPEAVGYHDYLALMDQLHPGRGVAALFIPAALSAAGMPDANRYVAEETSKDASGQCRGLFFVKPTDDPEWVRQEVKRLGLHGLKCYHTHAARQPTWDADIPDYLPEPLIRVAHEEGWPITLHVVKSRSMADPSNIFWVRHYCERYPDMKLILAHSARGFQPVHNLEGLPQLAGLGNLYFDTSANCEPMAHAVILRVFGHKRLMYGSDLPVSHLRGRPVGAGDSFVWLYEDTPVWGEKHLRVSPVLIGLEHLRSLKWACWSAKLSDSQVEDIFWNNAAKLLGVKTRPPRRAARPSAAR